MCFMYFSEYHIKNISYIPYVFRIQLPEDFFHWHYSLINKWRFNYEGAAKHLDKEELKWLKCLHKVSNFMPLDTTQTYRRKSVAY